jgi:hypothetical protein
MKDLMNAQAGFLQAGMTEDRQGSDRINKKGTNKGNKRAEMGRRNFILTIGNHEQKRYFHYQVLFDLGPGSIYLF